jgi:hypothetical protein
MASFESMQLQYRLPVVEAVDATLAAQVPAPGGGNVMYFEPSNLQPNDVDSDPDVDDFAITRIVGEGSNNAVNEAEEEQQQEMNDVDPRGFKKVPDASYTPLEGPHHKRILHLPQELYDELARPAVFPPPAAAVSNALPARVEQQRYDTPKAFFKLFFSDDVLDTLAVNTNLYAASKAAGIEGTRPWKPVSPAELKIWIGLLLYMSAIHQPNTAEYWYRNNGWPMHSISRFMGFTRFQEIKRYFHISPPVDQLPPERWTERLEPLNTILQERSKRLLVPATNVSIDETMARFQGRSKHTTTIRSKPVPTGYYVLCLCDAGYMYSWLFNSNSLGYGKLLENSANYLTNMAPNTALLSANLANTQKAVLHLMLQLPKDHFYTLYCDNLFTNCDLFHVLRALGHGACGTARATSKNWPFKGKLNRKTDRLPYNEVFVEVVHKDVAAIVWQDRQLVQFVTTAHDPCKMLLVKRRRPKAYTPWLRRIVADNWGSEGVKELEHPQFSVDYNNNMGGVDRHDQLRSYASTQLKALRNWFALFFMLLDIAVINSHILCKELYKGTKDTTITKQREYRLSIGWNLVIEGAWTLDRQWSLSLLLNNTLVPTGDGCFKNGNIPLGNSSASRADGYVTKRAQPPAFRLSHEPHNREQRLAKRRQCWPCRYTRTSTRNNAFQPSRTRRCCSICGPQYPLCEACEKEWHQR